MKSSDTKSTAFDFKQCITKCGNYMIVYLPQIERLKKKYLVSGRDEWNQKACLKPLSIK